ncbi:MAG: hypothetical protein ACOC2C_08625, partial [Cyclonatronaceae bacterium]
MNIDDKLGLFIGIGDFVLSIGSFRIPVFFIFGGMLALLIPLGLFLTSVGYMGAIARYQAGETMPVAKDSLNYMAEGTHQSLGLAARSIGEGLGAGIEAAQSGGDPS